MVTNQPARWGVICGAWGDMLISLVPFRERIGSGNIIYYGYDVSVADFLRLQEWVGEVIHVTPGSAEELSHITHTVWCNGGHMTEEMWQRLSSYDLPKDRVIGTSFGWGNLNPQPYQGQLQISSEALEWARRLIDGVPRPFFLINPFSFNSTQQIDHWPHWYEFMHTLLAGSDNHFFISGMGWSARDFSKYVNAHLLVNSAPTMMHLFALANICDGIITTSNNLSLWGIAQNLNTIVACNKQCSNDEYLFSKIMDQDDQASKVQVVKQGTSIKSLLTRLNQGFGIDFNGSLPYNLDNEFRVPKNFNYTFMPESRKFAHTLAPYLVGDGLDIGAGGDAIHGRVISVDTNPGKGQLIGNVNNLHWFRDNVLDYVYSSHLLCDFDDWTPVLKEWMRVVKPGGYLILQIPDHGRYRAFVNAGQTDHNSNRHDGAVGDLSAYVAEIGGWSIVMDKFAHPIDYNVLFVAQKNLL